MKETNEKWLYKDLNQEIIGAVKEVHQESFLKLCWDNSQLHRTFLLCFTNRAFISNFKFG